MTDEEQRMRTLLKAALMQVVSVHKQITALRVYLETQHQLDPVEFQKILDDAQPHYQTIDDAIEQIDVEGGVLPAWLFLDFGKFVH